MLANILVGIFNLNPWESVLESSFTVIRGKWAFRVERIVSRPENRARIWEKEALSFAYSNACGRVEVVGIMKASNARHRTRRASTSERLFDSRHESGSTSQTSEEKLYFLLLFIL